jgi:hypothetical protein
LGKTIGMRTLTFSALTGLAALVVACGGNVAADPLLPTEGLLADLDPRHGLRLEGDQVLAWTNQIPGAAQVFLATRATGRPVLRPQAIRGRPSVVFDKKELICAEEDAFDVLTTGGGHTWAAVVAPHRQRPGLKDVNAIFGNLRNGPQYEGFWACLNDDNSVWSGVRNGRSFGRFNADNPKLQGPGLRENRWALLAGRMDAGTGVVEVALFVDGPRAAARAPVAVNPAANPSKMAIGQERDAIEHPGHESFVGEIARLLFWSRPLRDEELAALFAWLEQEYR